ncbi:MAG: patatin-like phospholipase family protein [Sphingomonadaceae bacterium]
MKPQPGIVLALGGGAGLGWAHIGVLRALDEAGVRVLAVAGTSIGALAGVCFGAHRLDVLEGFARSANLKMVLRFIDPHWKRGAVLGGREIARQLEMHLGHIRFQDLHMPVSAVAADLLTGDVVIIDRGPVSEAVRASMALPGIFHPVALGDRLLVDGGVAMPVPVAAARALMPGRPLIAVNLLGDYQGRARSLRRGWTEKRSVSTFGVVRAATALMTANLTRHSLSVDPADVQLDLPVGHIDAGNFTRAEELIAIGRSAIADALPQISALIAA